MNQEQQDLLSQAQNSLEAAKLLHANGYFGFAASRSYYAMFYVAQAFLIGKGLAFSRHSAVCSAFGKHFVKTGIISSKFHQYLMVLWCKVWERILHKKPPRNDVIPAQAGIQKSTKNTGFQPALE